MNIIKKKLQLYIVCDDISFYQWISSTIHISNISPNIINHIAIASISEIKPTKSCEVLLIITNNVYQKKHNEIATIFSSYNIELPILVVMNTYLEPLSKNKTLTVVDTIIKPSLSIESLEHAIRSLLKDFTLTNNLKRLAHFDALTGAANRYLFEDRIIENLKRAKRYNEPFSLLYFDLNGFKLINDQYGHHTGDLLLKQFVKQLNTTKRDTDTIARLGGDEFCMLVPNTSIDNLILLIERIKHSLSQPFILSGQCLEIKSAIGAVNISDLSIRLYSAKEVLNLADKCVYKAKKFKETHVVLESL